MKAFRWLRVDSLMGTKKELGQLAMPLRWKYNYKRHHHSFLFSHHCNYTSRVHRILPTLSLKYTKIAFLLWDSSKCFKDFHQFLIPNCLEFLRQSFIIECFEWFQDHKLLVISVMTIIMIIMIETSSWWRSVPPTLGNPGDRRVTERKIIIVIITILVLISLASMIWLLFGRFFTGVLAYIMYHGWIALLRFPLIATDCPLQTDAPVILGLHTI